MTGEVHHYVAMDPAEFRDAGYLQELNRAFLHPLGLAMAVTEHDDGSVALGPIVDHRADLEGVCFDELDPVKAASVAQEMWRRRPVREKAMGFWQQPVRRQR